MEEKEALAPKRHRTHYFYQLVIIHFFIWCISVFVFYPLQLNLYSVWFYIGLHVWGTEVFVLLLLQGAPCSSKRYGCKKKEDSGEFS